MHCEFHSRRGYQKSGAASHFWVVGGVFLYKQRPGHLRMMRGAGRKFLFWLFALPDHCLRHAYDLKNYNKGSYNESIVFPEQSMGNKLHDYQTEDHTSNDAVDFLVNLCFGNGDWFFQSVIREKIPTSKFVKLKIWLITAEERRRLSLLSETSIDKQINTFSIDCKVPYELLAFFKNIGISKRYGIVLVSSTPIW